MEYKFKGTPGPWHWQLNEKSKIVHLENRRTDYVMDFVRYGMKGAQPRFNSECVNRLSIMEPAEKFGKIVAGREHHADWFKSIDHPDAYLIQAAPELLQACIAIANQYQESPWIKEQVLPAIHKALNIP